MSTPKANKLELLLRSITEHYADDPSAPGLAIAFILIPSSDRTSVGSFYVAIRRFRGYGGTKPEVVDSTQAPTLLEAINRIVKGWRARVTKTTATEQFLKTGNWQDEDKIPF